MLYFLLLLISTQIFASVGIEDHTLVFESYTLEKSGKVALAIDRMKKIAVSESDNYFVHMRLGHLFVLAKETLKATPYYAKAAELKPRSIEPWLALAKIAETQNDEVKSKNFLGEALKRDPYNHSVGTEYIKTTVRLKSFADGLDHAQDLLNVWPNDLYFLEQKAFFLAGLGKKAEAKTVLTDLLLLDPDNQYARSFMSKE